MNFHDQRIQWCKKTTCWYRQSSIRGKFVAMHGSGDDELHREMGTNADVLEETAMARRHCALKIHGGESNKVCLVQEHSKLSTAMVVASTLWRRSICKNIIKPIADLHEGRKVT